MSFSDFHGDNEIRLSVSKIELTIKDWKIAMRKLSCLGRNWTLKMANIWMKNPKKCQKIDKVSPKFYRNWLLNNGLLSHLVDMCISCLNNGLLWHWLDLQKSCLIDILKTASYVVLAVSSRHFCDVFEMSF